MTLAAAQQRLLEAQAELTRLQAQQFHGIGRQVRDAMHRVASEAVPEISVIAGGLTPYQRVAIEGVLQRRISDKLAAIADGA